MDKVIAGELEIIGSHGMQAHKYPEMLDMIIRGKLHPEKLIGRRITLDESLKSLTEMNRFLHPGLTVIDRF